MTPLRHVMGLAEGSNFPGAIKVVSEWFPKKERALATGGLNSGANVGALITPILVPFITIHFGWQSSFYVLGFVGLLWVPLRAVAYNDAGELGLA